MRTVGILALGGYEPEPERLARAQDFFAARGRRVLTLPAPEQRHQRFAADDDARLAALDQLIADADVDLIVALRGGYGVSRLLPRIDFAAVAAAIRGRGLRIVGHSDFTAFYLALLARTGAVSFAGPMASYDFGAESLDPLTMSEFEAVMTHPEHSVEFSADGPALSVDGTLWGGNLAMLCSLLGTPWMPHIADGILFLEDINEHPYRVERMLLQLQQAGVLAGQRALLLGDFSGYRLTGYDNGFDFATMIAGLRARIATPLLTGLPFGHCPTKLTLPVGARGTIESFAGHCRLTFRDYPQG